jgi:hypothetical protein
MSHIRWALVIAMITALTTAGGLRAFATWSALDGATWAQYQLDAPAVPLDDGEQVLYVSGHPEVSADGIRVLTPDGAPVAVRPHHGQTLSRWTYAYRSVAAFDAPVPGPYRVTVRASSDEVIIAPSLARISAWGTATALAALLVAGELILLTRTVVGARRVGRSSAATAARGQAR